MEGSVPRRPFSGAVTPAGSATRRTVRASHPPLDPTPLYQQLANIIETMIANGEYAPGQVLPGVATMAQEYGLAKGTVRAAIQVLRERGLIVTMPARGSYVIERD